MVISGHRKNKGLKDIKFGILGSLFFINILDPVLLHLLYDPNVEFFSFCLSSLAIVT